MKLHTSLQEIIIPNQLLTVTLSALEEWAMVACRVVLRIGRVEVEALADVAGARRLLH